MADTRQRTRIEIEVDDRKIRGLDQSLSRAFDDDMLSAFEKTIERATRNFDALTKAVERFDQVMKRTQQGAPAGGGSPAGGAPAGGAGGGGGRGPGGSSASLVTAITTLNQSIQQMQGAQQQAMASQPSFANRALATGVGSYLGGLGARLGTGEGFASQAVAGIPGVGGFLSGALNSIQRYYGMYGQAMSQRSRAVGALGTTNIPTGQFAGFGMDMPTAAGQASQFAQQAGLAGEGGPYGIDPGMYRRALQLQMLGGIQGGGTSILRAQGVGGGAVGGPRAMMAAVSAGIQSGIREAKLGQFIQAATGVLEQGRTEGAELRLANVLAVQRGFGGMGAGFRGEQGTRAMQTAVGALRQFKPQRDAASMIALRAAGFGSGKTYHEALKTMQEDPAAVLPTLVQHVRGMAPENQDAQIELMRQVLPKVLGFTPTITQAESLVRGDLTGFDQEAAGDTDRAEEFLQARQQRLRGAFATPAADARYRNQQISVGGAVAGAAQAVRQGELGIVRNVLPGIAKGVEGVIGYLKQLVDTFQEGGMGAVMKEMFGDALGGIGENIFKGLSAGAKALGMEGAAETLSEMGSQAAAIADNVGGELGQLTDLPETAIKGLMDSPVGDVMAGPEAVRKAVGEAGARVKGMITGEEPTGPLSNASDYIKRGAELMQRGAELLDEQGAPGEGELAMG